MKETKLSLKCTCTQVTMDKDKGIKSVVTLDKPLMSGNTELPKLSLPWKLEIGKEYNFVLVEVSEPVESTEPEGRLIREEDE